jgi:hypothetical protein
MTTPEARRHGPWWSGARQAVVLSALAVMTALVRDLLDSGRMTARLDYWLAQPVT